MELTKQARNRGEFGQSISRASLMISVKAATEALLAQQHPDGYWRYDLECFVFFPAFHVLTMCYTAEGLEPVLGQKIGNYLRRYQLPSGGWGLVPNSSDVDINMSIISYFALRLIGDKIDEEHMYRGRMAILKNGGIEGTNFNVRNYLALYGIVPWSSVPAIPVEFMLVPNWFPVTIYKIGFWARTTIVPMMVLQALKPHPRKPTGITLVELFCGNPNDITLVQPSNDTSKRWFYPFKMADKFIKAITPWIPSAIREKAIKSAVEYCTDRLNDKNGYGSINPPMQYVILMFDALGYSLEHPDRVMAMEALKSYEVIDGDQAYVTPCVTPTWDTAHVVDALLETGEPKALIAVEKALAWLRPLQIRDVQGDWAHRRPNLAPGGWAFFYKNEHFPDTDDTAYVLSGIHQMWRQKSSVSDQETISLGTNWLLGMQSQNGGWAAYDADNTYMYLNNIPFAYEDSLLDPPTVDVTGSVLLFLGQTGLKISNSEAVRRGVQFVLANQEQNGSWWGRWGVGYFWGTRFALTSLIAAGIPQDHPSVQKGVTWLLSIQNEDGGWGESVDTYKHRTYTNGPSTASQTSWALLALMAATELDSPAIELGIQYLIRTQNNHGQWDEEQYTGTGHPRVLYLLYHGYKKYYPLQVLARYLKMRTNVQVYQCERWKVFG